MLGAIMPPDTATDQYFIAKVQPDGPQVDTSSGETLLLSLEMGGANWSSSCRNGTCRTCIGRIVQGQVRYEIEWPGLSREEIDEGYALPCVAYPCSDLVLEKAD